MPSRPHARTQPRSAARLVISGRLARRLGTAFGTTESSKSIGKHGLGTAGRLFTPGRVGPRHGIAKALTARHSSRAPATLNWFIHYGSHRCFRSWKSIVGF